MFRRPIASSVALTVAAAAVLALSTAGYAYWTDVADGTGSSSTGSVEAVVVTSSGATPTSMLLPGAQAAAAFRVTNPNHFDVVITDVVQDGDITVSGGTGCDPTDAHVTFADQTDLEIGLLANAVDQEVEVGSTAVSMGTSAANGCQAATFRIPVHVSVRLP